MTYTCTFWGSVFDLDCCGSEGRRSPVCIVLGVLYTGLFYNWLKQNLYLATVGLLSEFSQSLLDWLIPQAADQEYLLQIPTVHSEEPPVLGSL